MSYDLYYWTTPNGHKLTIFFEEAGIDYTIKPINIGQGEQFDPAFLAISPNNRIPALVDHTPTDGQGSLSLFESGAMLLYLAEKHEKFIPGDLRQRADVLQWLFWQMGGLGPMLGQNHHFVSYAPETIPYAIDRYVNETNRLYGVLNKQLEGKDYICGDYSIADMACYPWIVLWERQKQDINTMTHLKAWFERMKARPAVIAAYEKAKAVSSEPVVSEEAKKVLFGQTSQVLDVKNK